MRKEGRKHEGTMKKTVIELAAHTHNKPAKEKKH